MTKLRDRIKICLSLALASKQSPLRKSKLNRPAHHMLTKSQNQSKAKRRVQLRKSIITSITANRRPIVSSRTITPTTLITVGNRWESTITRTTSGW
jgi:hypothetical protein